jgi:Domain of unknown function (DUF4274)
MDRFELSLERLHARQLEFLKNASPDDWHRYADNHNWDERLDGLFWIVSQPDCDMATALLIFWKGEPTGYDYETEEEDLGGDIYAIVPMLKYISKRFNTTGYARSEISYDFLADHGINMPEYFAMCEAGRLRDIELLIERQKTVADSLVKLHPNMRLLNVAGRKVGGYGDTGDFYELFPTDVDEDDAEQGDAQEALASDTSADASARTRAMRRQAQSTKNSTSCADQASSSLQTRAKPGMPASMENAWIEAAALFVALFVSGAAAAFAPKLGFATHASPLFWVVSIASITYCLHYAVSSLRTLLSVVEAKGLQLSRGWIKTTATIAALAGLALGRAGTTYFLDTAVTPLLRIGLAAVAMVAVVVVSFTLALVLIHPRAFRQV